MSTTSESWLPLGTNFYRIIDDLIEIALHGEFSLADANHYVALLELMRQTHGYTLTLFNLNDGQPLSPQVRKYLGQYSNQTVNPAALASFGGSIGSRLFGRLMIRGINLLRRVPLSVNFFDREQEAQAWLHSRRRQIRTSA